MYTKPYRRKSQAKFKGPTKAAILKGNQAGWLTIITPYNANFVDELKSTIQPSHRQWDPSAKAWRVNEIYLEELVPMLQRYFDEIETDLTTEPSSNNLFVEVFKIVNGQYRDKVYYALAQALHPDHGGSQELMTKLNAAYQETK